MSPSGAPMVHIAPHRELVGVAWIERKTRSDGGTSAVVRWRLGGSRTGRTQAETFGAGSDDQNLARKLAAIERCGRREPAPAHGVIRR